MYDVNTCFVQAHIEMQEGLAGAQKDTLEGLQESTMKMMSQQAEAAQYTADAARHIKEVSYLSLALFLYFVTKSFELLSFSDVTVYADLKYLI